MKVSGMKIWFYAFCGLFVAFWLCAVVSVGYNAYINATSEHLDANQFETIISDDSSVKLLHHTPTGVMYIKSKSGIQLMVDASGAPLTYDQLKELVEDSSESSNIQLKELIGASEM